VSTVLLFGATAVVIFAMATHAVITTRHLLRKLIAVNVMGSSVFLLLVTMAGRFPGEPDPVPHAMVLTGIIVTVGTTGLAVALLRRHIADGHPPDLSEPKNPKE
jgi:multicomponent Na+:H+ antiporter subunit C